VGREEKEGRDTKTKEKEGCNQQTVHGLFHIHKTKDSNDLLTHSTVYEQNATSQKDLKERNRRKDFYLLMCLGKKLKINDRRSFLVKTR